MIDISKLSVNELKALQEEASVLIEKKKEQVILNACDEINRIALSVGFSVEDLLEEGNNRSKKMNRKVVPARYRNNDDYAQTWSGRGKQPLWLVEKLKAGAKLEDLLIRI